MKPWLTALMLAAWLPLAPCSRAEAPALRSSFDVQVPVAPTPVAVIGKARLVYELHLSNFATQALALRRVQAVDADDGRVLADLADEALKASLGRPGLASAADPREFAAGTRGVLYVEITLDAARPPHAIRHRIDYGDAGTSVASAIETEPVAILPAPLPVLGPPLRGGPWAAIYDPSWPRGHRRMLYAVDGRARIPGRHAIDWILLDADGRKASGDDDRIAHWHGYGADVLAVADARVAAVRDDVAESATLAGHHKHALADASGNYIALDLGDGRFAFYEHLRPGSVRVRAGDRVRRGQAIAALGFTGDSTGPHLHFHVADAASPLAAEGRPYVLDAFELLGAYDNLDGFGKSPWQPRGEDLDARRRAELPPSNSVVVFPSR